ncbi:MAG: amidophosphoribosyltransferase, partial [Candidatus Kapaibacterium sp.]
KKESQLEQLREALQITRGAYSLVVMTDTALYAARDPHGFRPLCIGRIRNADGTDCYVVASESCALDIISAEYVREVRHNEIVVIDAETVRTGEIASYTIEDETPEARHCIFEYIYFSRPDSKIFGHNVDKVRRALGKRLAVESPVETGDYADVTVVAVPDSGNTATLGFARMNEKENGIPSRYEIGLIRSHYVGRTFIAPGQDKREFKVKTKFNVVRGVLEGKKVVLVDDSIVRGTTSKARVTSLKEAGAKSVHVLISCPPHRHPCVYGIDFPERSKLMAANHSHDEIRQYLNADSLGYLSEEGMVRATGLGKEAFCLACYNGDYPVPYDPVLDKHIIERRRQRTSNLVSELDAESRHQRLL